jgi:hypothetical protein
MAAGWRQEPEPADPATSRWTRTPAAPSSAFLSVHATAALPDEHSLPSTDPPHPRLERVLSWIAPGWVARRQAIRVARRRYAIAVRLTAAHNDRHRAPDLPSRFGPAWRASRFWHR